MRDKTVSLTLRIPPDVHKKLKILSVVSGKTMTDEIIQMIEKVNLKVPDFSKPAKKKVAPRGEVSTEEDIRPIVMDMKAEGLSLQKICDHLNDKGLPTVTGHGTWGKGSLQRMILRWEAQGGVK
jgi:hypothetical protein